MPFATRDELLAIQLPTTVVILPDGRSVRVRGMTGQERDEFEAAMIFADKRGRLSMNFDFMKRVRGWVVTHCLVDEFGKRVFSDDDIPVVADMPALFLQPIYEAARRLSALDAKDIEDLGKASETVLVADSGSA